MKSKDQNQISYVSEEGVEKYQALCQKHFKEQLSKKEAQEELIQLVRFMEIVYRPMTEAELEQVNKRRRELGITEE